MIQLATRKIPELLKKSTVVPLRQTTGPSASIFQAEYFDHKGFEGPQTAVTISRGFWMGSHEVSRREYKAVLRANPSYFTNDLSRPVEMVSWEDATNRAMLFLVNEKESVLEGVMGIGPHSAEEAGKIWSAVSNSSMTLEDFIASYDTFKNDPESKLNTLVKGMKIPLREDMGILALTILEGMPFEITTEDARKMVDPDIMNTLNTNYFVTVPLKAKDKILGAILVDNIFNKKPINKSDVRMLTMFANHAGLAIENSRLFEETINLANTDWLTGSTAVRK